MTTTTTTTTADRVARLVAAMRSVEEGLAIIAEGWLFPAGAPAPVTVEAVWLGMAAGLERRAVGLVRMDRALADARSICVATDSAASPATSAMVASALKAATAAASGAAERGAALDEEIFGGAPPEDTSLLSLLRALRLRVEVAGARLVDPATPRVARDLERQFAALAGDFVQGLARLCGMDLPHVRDAARDLDPSLYASPEAEADALVN